MLPQRGSGPRVVVVTVVAVVAILALCEARHHHTSDRDHHAYHGRARHHEARHRRYDEDRTEDSRDSHSHGYYSHRRDQEDDGDYDEQPRHRHHHRYEHERLRERHESSRRNRERRERHTAHRDETDLSEDKERRDATEERMARTERDRLPPPLRKRHHETDDTESKGEDRKVRHYRHFKHRGDSEDTDMDEHKKHGHQRRQEDEDEDDDREDGRSGRDDRDAPRRRVRHPRHHGRHTPKHHVHSRHRVKDVELDEEDRPHHRGRHRLEHTRDTDADDSDDADGEESEEMDEHPARRRSHGRHHHRRTHHEMSKRDSDERDSVREGSSDSSDGDQDDDSAQDDDEGEDSDQSAADSADDGVPKHDAGKSVLKDGPGEDKDMGGRGHPDGETADEREEMESMKKVDRHSDVSKGETDLSEHSKHKGAKGHAKAHKSQKHKAAKGADLGGAESDDVTDDQPPAENPGHKASEDLAPDDGMKHIKKGFSHPPHSKAAPRPADDPTPTNGDDDASPTAKPVQGDATDTNGHADLGKDEFGPGDDLVDPSMELKMGDSWGELGKDIEKDDFNFGDSAKLASAHARRKESAAAKIAGSEIAEIQETATDTAVSRQDDALPHALESRLSNILGNGGSQNAEGEGVEVVSRPFSGQNGWVDQLLKEENELRQELPSLSS